MTNGTMNPWKLTTIGLLLVGATALVTTFVVGQRSEPEEAQKPQPRSSAPRSSAVERPRPSQAMIANCNEYAEARVDKTADVLKDAAVGALLGAGVGAAGGAIADGGKGAGKGAAIGGVVGATGGVLYGLNKDRSDDSRYRAEYAYCLRTHGYN